MNDDFTLTRGDTRTLDVEVDLPPGSTFDLSSATSLKWTAKRQATDADAVFEKTEESGITVTGATTATIAITEADWSEWRGEETLVWDLEARTATPEVVTLAIGRLTVLSDVSR